MGDLESALLASALGFARGRLSELLTTLAPDAEHLLAAVLGQPPSAPQAAALQGVAAGVDAHLTAAAAHLATLTTLLAGPPADLAGAAAAADELGGALGEVHQAVVAAAAVVPEVGDAEQALLRLVHTATAVLGSAFSGLVADLGLAAPGTAVADGLTATGTVLRYALGHTDTRTLPAPPGVVLSLSASTLSVALDYGAAPPSLGLSLTTGLTAGLVADGLVAQLLPAGDVSATVTVGVDTTRGLSLGAGGKGRVSLPGSLSVPGIDLRDLGLELPAGGAHGFDVTSVLAGALGPMAAVLDGAGVRLGLDPARLLAGGGGAVSVGARPPDGAGLTLDAGIVRGGGYVEHRVGADGVTEYGGALDLRVGPVEITAVGLLTPDPFSLVLVLGVRFTVAIQLSFGFTLNAVGGVLALERTVSTDELRARLHDHTADTILFPADPVGAAPTILAALAAVFPRQPGGFVVGPMLELGWGVPVSFVTARLGVLIALPDPKVILIGSLRLALPAPEAPIVDVRASLYGEITPDHLLFLVSLEGSRLAGFSLSGDFGLLIGFGDDPEFALSAGGFHPHYTPPGELTGMRRVAVDISPPSVVTMRAEAYLALTSNSFQLGCRVELHAEVAGIGAEGHLGFDALVRWAPHFSFEIDLDAGVSLFAFGETFASIDLHLHLAGPGRWVAHGTASISLLFFDIDLEIGPLTWGEDDNPPPDPVSPQQLVHDALGKASAWESRLPPDADELVRLAPAPADELVVHPLGALEARQKAVPLETVIDRVGPHPVSETRVNLGAPTVGALAAQAVSNATELFAPGAFLDLTDDQKLSRPAFEPFPAGVVLNGADAEATGTPVETAYHWDTVFPPRRLPHVRDDALFAVETHAAVLYSGPAGTAAPRARNPYAVAPVPVVLADAGTATVVGTRDLAPVAGVTGAMTTTAAARAVADLVAGDPSLAGAVQYAGAGVAP